VDRFTWGIVVGAVLLVAAGIGIVAAVQRAPAPADLSTPEGVVRAYVEALDRGQPERAWDLLADRLQAEVSRDEFVRRTTQSFGGPREGRVAIEQVVVEGNTARVELSRTFSGSGGPFGLFGPSSYTSRQTARLELQGGRWKITVPPDDFLVRRAPDAIVVTATPAPAATAPPGPTATR
jgi:hypothetical protein